MELNGMLETTGKGYKYGFSLYLWLALFAIFISFFSIILFNYVGSDIKAVRSIYKESRMYYDIKSILSAITEIYREKNFNRPSDVGIRQGSYGYANGVVNYNVRYEIRIVEGGTNPNPNYLFIDLYRGNKLWARGIVKWRESIGDLGLITAKSAELFKSNSFYSNAAVFSDTINIQNLTSQDKIFKKVSIQDGAVVNGKTSSNFENIKEIQKFAEYVEINNSLNAIMRYYNDLRDEVIRKVVDPMVNYGTQYSNAGNIILTPYGAIWIREIPNVSYVKINFNMDNNGNQIISFLDNNGNLLSTYIILMYGSLNINLDFNDEVITNDIGIINQVNYNVNNISLVPVSKVMNVNGRHYTIYTNVGDYSTIIYSDMPILIGSDGPENMNNARINSKVMIISNDRITVKNNVIYSNFNSLGEFISLCSDQGRILFNNDNNDVHNGLLRVIGSSIIFDTSDYNIGDPNRNKQCLSGQFVSMYNSGSLVKITNPSNIEDLYVFGSVKASNREGFAYNFKERYITDGRLVVVDQSLGILLDNIDNSIYMNKIAVQGIEIIEK